MRSPRLLISVAAAFLTLRGRVALGQTARRLRNLVEVSDLKTEDASETKPQDSRLKLEVELAFAQEEIYRLLEMDGAPYSFSTSMSLLPPVKPVLTEAPVPVEPPPTTPGPVATTETDPPVSIDPPTSVAVETPAPVAIQSPSLVVDPPSFLSLSPVAVETPAFPVSSEPPTSTKTQEPASIQPISTAPVSSTTTAKPTCAVSNAPIVSPPPVSERDLLIQEKCGMTEDERGVKLEQIATDFFGEASDHGSHASDWVINEDPAILCPVADRIYQRLTVAVIYFTMDGANWINCGVDSDGCINTDDRITRTPLKWMTSDHECIWYGLFCEGVAEGTTPPVNETFSLTVIDLPDNNMGGTLPVEIFGLGLLQVLTLDGNGRIGGTIPSDVAKLSRLTVIDLDNNMLTGTLPSELFTMTNLAAIDLNDNKLLGILPSTVGNLLNLGVLQLENNQLTGALPEAGLFLLEKMGTLQLLVDNLKIHLDTQSSSPFHAPCAVLLTLENNSFTGSLETLCSVAEERRVQNNFPEYLQFVHTDCAGSTPKVQCSCCKCFPL